MDLIPQLAIQDFSGRHNIDLTKSAERLIKSRSSVDLSTACLIPNSGLIPAKVAENWINQTTQMNQKLVRFMAIGTEKNFAYNALIEQILANPVLQTFKYILTMEELVLAPMNALSYLFESIEKYDVVGGLAWSPGTEGHPMIYGEPNAFPLSFVPINPIPETVQPCLGLGTGFTLFKTEIFKDTRIPKPWFRTPVQHDATKTKFWVPDMYFFENIHKLGYKVACDTRVRLGCYDPMNEIVW